MRALLITLILAGCGGPTLPEALRDLEHPARLHDAIAQHCEGKSRGCHADLERNYCEAKGGSWRQFSNGCRDHCAAPRHPVFEGPRICTTDMPMGCDCGDDQCWDGLRCATPPPAGPLFEPAFEPLPAECRAQLEGPTSTPEQIRAGLACAVEWSADLFERNRAAAERGAGYVVVVSCLDEKRSALKALEALSKWQTERQNQGEVLKMAGLKAAALVGEVGACVGR